MKIVKLTCSCLIGWLVHYETVILPANKVTKWRATRVHTHHQINTYTHQSATSSAADANLCKDPHRQDHHLGRRILGHHRHGKVQDSGQGGYPARPAAVDICWEAVGGRTHLVRLQHSKRVDAAFGAAPARWMLIVIFICTKQTVRPMPSKKYMKIK